MKKTLFFLACLFGLFSHAQHSISGTFSPADEYSWLIAYRLTSNDQAYVADTKINNGQFLLKLPENALEGTYRLVYAVPQDEFYFDILYSGKEDIILSFKSGEEVAFSASKENILFNTYFKEITEAEQKINTYYTSKRKNTNEYLNLNKNVSKIQKTYESKAKGLLVENFIKANQPFIATEYLSPEDYINNKKKRYFKHLDLNNTILKNSPFLKTKLLNYAFTALPLKKLSDSETENEIQSNIKLIANKIEKLSDDDQFAIFYSIWEYATTLELNNTADFIFTEYLSPKATSEANKKTLNEVEVENRLRIGALAPEIEWQSKGKTKKLSSINNATNYILIFWSSTCSHCLHELPPLHKELKKFPNTQVIAIGLENDELNWKIESDKLDGFEHAIALGKWNSTYAKLYDIHQTPTYIILDKEKRIVAKPKSDKDIIAFLKH